MRAQNQHSSALTSDLQSCARAHGGVRQRPLDGLLAAKRVGASCIPSAERRSVVLVDKTTSRKHWRCRGPRTGDHKPSDRAMVRWHACKSSVGTASAHHDLKQRHPVPDELDAQRRGGADERGHNHDQRAPRPQAPAACRTHGWHRRSMAVRSLSELCASRLHTHYDCERAVLGDRQTPQQCE